jgi:hypothetical protein
MKISHEVPLCLLDESLSFNDYDYFLIHLFEQHPEYVEFFETSKRLGRTQILDNSVFELGKAFDVKLFAECVERYEPSEYIIPDVLDQADATIYCARKWHENYKHLKGTKIGVVQGKTPQLAAYCYTNLKPYVDKIAFNFMGAYLTVRSTHLEKDMRNALERARIIDSFLENGWIDTKMPHHLLGCSVPQEFTFYKNLDFIKTIDTSNPVVHAMKGIKYENWGLGHKESVKLADLINADKVDIDLNILNHNISTFKTFVGR